MPSVVHCGLQGSQSHTMTSGPLWYYRTSAAGTAVLYIFEELYKPWLLVVPAFSIYRIAQGRENSDWSQCPVYVVTQSMTTSRLGRASVGSRTLKGHRRHKATT